MKWSVKCVFPSDSSVGIRHLLYITDWARVSWLRRFNVLVARSTMMEDEITKFHHCHFDRGDAFLSHNRWIQLICSIQIVDDDTFDEGLSLRQIQKATNTFHVKKSEHHSQPQSEHLPFLKTQMHTNANTRKNTNQSFTFSDLHLYLCNELHCNFKSTPINSDNLLNKHNDIYICNPLA